MKVGIFDLETTSFYADGGIILCGSVKTYGQKKLQTVRADQFPSWKTGKSNNKDVVIALSKILKEFDILVMHNGEFFDKGFFNAKCVEYDLDPVLRFKKTIDPCLLSRRHMRMGRNSLVSLIYYFNVKNRKTPVVLADWIRAGLDNNQTSMNKIVKHNKLDVITLEEVYDKVRPLIDKVDKKGSSF